MEQKAMELLENFANTLGVTIEHLWSVMVKQAYATATVKGLLINIGWWVFPILIGIGLFLFLFGAIREKRDEYNSFDEGLMMWGLGISIMSFIVGVIVLVYLYTSLYYLQANPEYWALEKVMSVIKGQ